MAEKKANRLMATSAARYIYQQRHERGENYGLFVDNSLEVVTSLTGVPACWHDLISCQE